MKTYWDLSESERAELSAEDVERYTSAELMARGVLRVAPLKLQPEPSMAQVAKGQMFVPYADDREYGSRGNLGVAFASAEQAHAFLALKPYALKHLYMGGASVTCAQPLSETEVKIEALPLFDDVNAERQNFERVGAVREANVKARREYDTASRAQKEALDGLYQDWQRCKERGEKMRHIAATFADYTTTAGDPMIAAGFLRKVFTVDDIESAAEWCGVGIPARAGLDVAAPEPVCVAGEF